VLILKITFKIKNKYYFNIFFNKIYFKNKPLFKKKNPAQSYKYVVKAFMGSIVFYPMQPFF